jgi:hypothetical protein
MAESMIGVTLQVTPLRSVKGGRYAMQSAFWLPVFNYVQNLNQEQDTSQKRLNIYVHYHHLLVLVHTRGAC